MNRQDIFKTIKMLAVALILTLGANLVFAGSWTPAPANPPANNVDAPINVGSQSQGKAGAFGLGSATPPSASSGNIFEVIGNSFFNGTLLAGHLVASSPSDSEAIKAYRGEGTSYVSLGVSSTGGGVLNSPVNDVYIQNPSTKNTLLNAAGGKVGVGLTSPRSTATLDVKGEIDATGDICTDLGGRKCLSTVTGGTTGGTGGGSLPSDTGPLQIESFNRGPSTFSVAFKDCLDQGKRLPTSSELNYLIFQNNPPADSSVPYLWTITPSDASTGYANEILQYTGSPSVIQGSQLGNQRSYRCVTGRATGGTGVTGGAGGATGGGTSVNNSQFCYALKRRAPINHYLFTYESGYVLMGRFIFGDIDSREGDYNGEGAVLCYTGGASDSRLDTAGEKDAFVAAMAGVGDQTVIRNTVGLSYNGIVDYCIGHSIEFVDADNSTYCPKRQVLSSPQ